jgi:hypothetical protein
MHGSGEPKNNRAAPSGTLPVNEETGGATGALETPATPPDMTKDGKVNPNKSKSE